MLAVDIQPRDAHLASRGKIRAMTRRSEKCLLIESAGNDKRSVYRLYENVGIWKVQQLCFLGLPLFIVSYVGWVKT